MAGVAFRASLPIRRMVTLRIFGIDASPKSKYKDGRNLPMRRVKMAGTCP
jgi:hypothetical protein